MRAEVIPDVRPELMPEEDMATDVEIRDGPAYGDVGLAGDRRLSTRSFTSFLDETSGCRQYPSREHA